MEQEYLSLLERIMDEGVDRDDRTGTGTRSVFGHQMRFDLSKGFPLLTTKRVSFNLIKSELLWFLKEIRILNTYSNIITIFGMSGPLNVTSNQKIIVARI